MSGGICVSKMADNAGEEQAPVDVQVAIPLSDDELDIHVCGRCKESFTDLSEYIDHKKTKACSKKGSPTTAKIIVPTTRQAINLQIQSFEVSTPNDTAKEVECNDGKELPSIIPESMSITPLVEEAQDSLGELNTGNKVVVEILDPVDIRCVTDSDVDLQTSPPEVKHDHGYSRGLEGTDNDKDVKPTKRRKRKSSTPKTTRKHKTVGVVSHQTDPRLQQDPRAKPTPAKDTITVHIPESQLVHLGTAASSAVGSTHGMRKQGPTSVFVPIYLTNSNRNFKCSKCPAEFKTKEEREEHGSLHRKNFKCVDCSKRYFTIEALEAHKANETHIHTCEQCGKVFHSQVYLRRHKTVHVEDRNFPCDVCNKSYTSDANRRAHKRSVHALVKKHKCDECGKAFARKDKLKRHQLIHIPYPNRPVFPCPFRSHTGCMSTFYREDKLKRHLFTHSKEKPYKCDECGKGFARRDNMNDHIRTHTKVFSHVCQICQRGFLGPAKLKKHLRGVHGIVEPEGLAQDLEENHPPTMAIVSLPRREEPRSVEITEEGGDAKSTEHQGEESDGTISEVSIQEEETDSSAEEVENTHNKSQTDTEQNVPIAREEVHPTVKSLRPSMPLIHHPNPASTGRPSHGPGQVFVPPGLSFPPGVYSTRDMLTLPNELLTMVRGLNS